MKEEEDIINPNNINNEKEENEESDENEEDEYYYNSQLTYNKKFDIGRNIIWKNKYVFGIKNNLPEFFLLITYNTICYVIWIIFIYPFFYFYNFPLTIIFNITNFLFLFALYFHIKCFLTEPGIIPRNSPIYQKDNSYKFIYSLQYHRPIIMIQRNCMTCSICRPNNCSHCFMCNNCVEEFDQHFIFVSNCIGKRNRKFFFYFLLFNFLYYFFIIFSSIIQLILIQQKYILIYQKLFKNYWYYLILIIILIICSIIFYKVHRRNYNLYCISILNILYIYIFYKNKYNFTEELPIYLSPFNFVLIIIILPSIFFNFMYISNQIQMICMGLTNNEYKNIKNFKNALREGDYEDNFHKSKDDKTNCIAIKEIPQKDFIPKINIKDSIKNFKKFLKRKVSPSLIYQEINIY